jgi:hypothetical protein
MRTTKETIENKVNRLREMGIDIEVEWAMGRPRCVSKKGSKDLSPRLSKPEMVIWLDGFMVCVFEGIDQVIAENERKSHKPAAIHG